MRRLFASLGAAIALATAPAYAQQTPQMQPKGLTPHQQAQLQQLAAYAKKEHLKPICEYVKKNPTGMMKTFDGQTVYFHVFPDVFGTTTVECGQHFAVKSFQGTHSIFLYDVQKDGSVDVSVYVDRDVDPVHVPIIDREALVPGVLEAAIAADHRHPVGVQYPAGNQPLAVQQQEALRVLHGCEWAAEEGEERDGHRDLLPCG